MKATFRLAQVAFTLAVSTASAQDAKGWFNPARIANKVRRDTNVPIAKVVG